MPLPPDPDDPRNVLLTTEQAAKAAHVEPRLIRLWAHRGQLTAVPGTESSGNGPLYLEADVLRTEAATRQRPREERLCAEAVADLTAVTT